MTVGRLVLLLAGLLVCPRIGAQRGYGAYSYDSPFGRHSYDLLGPRRNHRVGRHWLGDDAFDDFYGSGNDYYRYKCPEYKPASVSRWRETHDGRVSSFVALPGVHPDNQRAWLSEDGTSLQVRAVRSISAQGGRRCLPRNARLNADATAEILEVEVPMLVSVVDASRAAVRNVPGGVEVLVPKRRQPSRDSTKQASPHPAAEDPVTQPTMRKQAPLHQHTVAQPVRTVTLPPSDGIEVIDEDWPEPEKLPDAAEGWMDNRGEFQNY